MINKRKILICPLNWGLGHAARDILLIKLFIKNNFEPIIASSGLTSDLLRKEFPELKFIEFPGYTIRFSKYQSQVIMMLILIPKIIIWIVKEHIVLKRIIQDHKIDVVFSDNRFGLWNKKTYNIFMTHQLRVIFPGILRFGEPIYQFVSYHLIKKYDECWVPDYKGDINLSGELSHLKCKLKNIHYVGPLSKFAANKIDCVNKKFDVLFILSGPEPQRSIFEKKIYNQTRNTQLSFGIVRGSSEKGKFNFEFPAYDICKTEELFSLISVSKLIVCRSGYSSVMDMFILRKNAVFIPTPGQTEQEYLAKYLLQRGMYYSVSQQKFKLTEILKNVIDFPKIQFYNKKNLEKRLIALKEMYDNK